MKREETQVTPLVTHPPRIPQAPAQEAHDYEPGDTAHPMSTDPDCRVCGRTRRACEGR